MRMHAVIALALTITAFPTLAQERLSRQDRHFIEHATSAGITEVQLGKLASERASNEAVRDFGQRMMTDHAQANKRLSEVAAQLDAPAAKEPSHEHRRAADRLRKLTGAEFDQAYIATMVDDHRKSVKTFQRQAESGNATALKSFAQQTLPTLEEHLAQAERIRDQLQPEQAQVPR